MNVPTTGRWPSEKHSSTSVCQASKADNGAMVSTEVVTAAPVEAAEWPLAAIELVARLRAESAAIVAAVFACPVDET